MKTSKFKTPQGTELPKTRKHLNADALFKIVRSEFSSVKDPRSGNANISMTDVLMSGLAVFALKAPSLLAFDQHRKRDTKNLEDVFGIGQVPCDTQLREILDKVDPAQLRGACSQVFNELQRGNVLEQMKFLGKYYLVSADGTGFYYSSNLRNDFCLEKTPRGQVEKAYHQQLYAACLVHPDFREVIPFCPELIVKQDGKNKNDCEQNASICLIRNFRREPPILKLSSLKIPCTLMRLIYGLLLPLIFIISWVPKKAIITTSFKKRSKKSVLNQMEPEWCKIS